MPRATSRKSQNNIEISQQAFIELTKLAAQVRTVKVGKAPRKKSKYNLYVSAKMAEYKTSNPRMTHQERFSQAVKSWKECKKDPECVRAVPRTLTVNEEKVKSRKSK